jgi:hypothetical protein
MTDIKKTEVGLTKELTSGSINTAERKQVGSNVLPTSTQFGEIGYVYSAELLKPDFSNFSTLNI